MSNKQQPSIASENLSQPSASVAGSVELQAAQKAVLTMPKPYVKPRTSAAKIRDSQLSARRIIANEASKRAAQDQLGSKPFSQLVHEQEYQAAEYLVNQKVNYYTFTTDMQERMLDLVKPCLENQLADRQQVKELQLYHNKLSKRLQYMEACFNQ